jgi:hypothetical protein
VGGGGERRARVGLLLRRRLCRRGPRPRHAGAGRARKEPQSRPGRSPPPGAGGRGREGAPHVDAATSAALFAPLSPLQPREKAHPGNLAPHAPSRGRPLTAQDVQAPHAQPLQQPRLAGRGRAYERHRLERQLRDPLQQRRRAARAEELERKQAAQRRHDQPERQAAGGEGNLQQPHHQRVQRAALLGGGPAQRPRRPRQPSVRHVCGVWRGSRHVGVRQLIVWRGRGRGEGHAAARGSGGGARTAPPTADLAARRGGRRSPERGAPRRPQPPPPPPPPPAPRIASPRVTLAGGGALRPRRGRRRGHSGLQTAAKERGSARGPGRHCRREGVNRARRPRRRRCRRRRS